MFRLCFKYSRNRLTSNALKLGHCSAKVALQTGWQVRSFDRREMLVVLLSVFERKAQHSRIAFKEDVLKKRFM